MPFSYMQIRILRPHLAIPIHTRSVIVPDRLRSRWQLSHDVVLVLGLFQFEVSALQSFDGMVTRQFDGAVIFAPSSPIRLLRSSVSNGQARSIDTRMPYVCRFFRMTIY